MRRNVRERKWGSDVVGLTRIGEGKEESPGGGDDDVGGFLPKADALMGQFANSDAELGPDAVLIQVSEKKANNLQKEMVGVAAMTNREDDTASRSSHSPNSRFSLGTSMGRDRRFLDSIQATLGSPHSILHAARGQAVDSGQTSMSYNSVPAVPTRPPSASHGHFLRRNAAMPISTVHKAKDLDEMIAQLHCVRNGQKQAISAADIALTIAQKANISPPKWREICQALIKCALNSEYATVPIEACKAIIVHSKFQSAMEKELKEECVRFILGDDLPGDGRFVKFCAGILVAEYPPAFSKAVDGNNLVLFALFASINGWLMTIRSNMEEPVDKHDVDLGGSLNLGDRCARAIAELILASERRLWILWPYLVDDIYIVVKDAISGLPNGTKETRQVLLEAVIAMNNWIRRPSGLNGYRFRGRGYEHFRGVRNRHWNTEHDERLLEPSLETKIIDKDDKLPDNERSPKKASQWAAGCGRRRGGRW